MRAYRLKTPLNFYYLVRTALRFLNILTLVQFSKIQIEAFKSTFQFILHNKRSFVDDADAGNLGCGGVVLIEFSRLHSAHIAYSYLSNALRNKSNANFIAYFPNENKSLKVRIKLCIEEFFNWSTFGVYRSFGVSQFLSIRTNQSQRVLAKSIFDELTPQLHSKNDVENLVVRGIWIGDLIYDTYLRKKGVPTIDISCKEFQRFLLESIELVVFWEEYFSKRQIKGLIVSHCVYNNAIPLRISVANGIPSFQANITHIYRLSSERLFAYNEFMDYPASFDALPPEIKSEGLKEAAKRISRRFNGEIGVDMAYSKKSAFSCKNLPKLIRDTDRKKILVAAHCFFDSPHSYGKNLFPDFMEWIDFLGSISEVTDYDWYIKSHPDYLDGTKKVLDDFVSRNAKFCMLPPQSSHHQIIKEGIDVALTCYGTIGFEYAALGIPVINASMNNPHVAYNFNKHPQTVDEYKKLLLNLDNLDLDIDKTEIYQYYFMRFIYNTDNLFFHDYHNTLAQLGGYKTQFTPTIYRKWLEHFSEDYHIDLNKRIHSFLNSREFRMR